MKRFMIAGTKSGCGKTTVTCAVLSALKKRGISPVSFKCGPDYIDPMFHRQVIGVKSYNLDSFFCGEDTLKYLLTEGSNGFDAAVIEGVMGFYDGDEGSAYSVSQITDTPVIIVIDCKGMSNSIGAVMRGFLDYRRPNNIEGFIFDRLPVKLIPLVQRLCDELDTQYFGCMPQNDLTFESRHLGLVTAAEIDDIQGKISLLGELAEQYISIDKILEIESSEIKNFSLPDIKKFTEAPTIAVAYDKAFCFMYAENIELLEKFGCTVKNFSPLDDAVLPEADGLILCGGYPELYAEQLSQNVSLMSDIKEKISSGMPIIAECGGFMYLHEKLIVSSGNSFPMVGAVKGDAFPTERLQRFGYITMTASGDNMLFREGDPIKAHEFHYWESTNCGADMFAEKKDGRAWKCAHTGRNIYAGFPHIYFYSDTSIAERFVKSCIDYGGKNGQDK